SGKGRGPAPSPTSPAAASQPSTPVPLPMAGEVLAQADEEEALEELELILEPEMIVEEPPPIAELVPEPLPSVSDGWSDQLDVMPPASTATSSIPLPGNIPSRPASPDFVAAASSPVAP